MAGFDPTTISAIAASPVLMAAFVTYVMTKLKEIEGRIDRQERKIDSIDRKLDELLGLVKYVQGRVNSIDRHVERRERRWQGR